MHLLENFSLLTADLQPEIQPEPGKFGAKLLERFAATADIDNHHHVEIVLDDGLGYVKNVDVVLGEICAGLGKDTYSIFADDGYDGFFHNADIIAKAGIVF